MTTRRLLRSAARGVGACSSRPGFRVGGGPCVAEPPTRVIPSSHWRIRTSRAASVVSDPGSVKGVGARSTPAPQCLARLCAGTPASYYIRVPPEHSDIGILAPCSMRDPLYTPSKEASEPASRHLERGAGFWPLPRTRWRTSVGAARLSHASRTPSPPRLFDFCWIRSSPIAEAAFRASATCCRVIGSRNGVPLSSGTVDAAPAHAPPKQSACNSKRTESDAAPLSRRFRRSMVPEVFWM